jgi:hypothetical protein
MVRNIVGTLLEAGKGNQVVCGPTAPACGLFLVEVEY